MSDFILILFNYYMFCFISFFYCFFLPIHYFLIKNFALLFFRVCLPWHESQAHNKSRRFQILIRVDFILFLDSF
jgi:hypothetical protein